MIDKITNFIDRLISDNLNKVKKLNRFITLLCLVFFIQFFNQKSIELTWDYRFLFSSFLILIGYLFQSISWSFIISDKLEIKNILSWFNSIIGKYLPLKIGIPLLRMTDENNSNNLDSKKYFTGILVEVLLQVFTAIIFILVFFISEVSTFSYQFCLILYFLMLFGYYLIYKGKYTILIITNTLSYLFFLMSVVFSGFILYQVPNVEIGIAYILTSVISLLFVGSPAGLGIREYLFILLFQSNPNFVSINFLEFLIYIRLVFIFSDIFSYLVGRLTKFLNI